MKFLYLVRCGNVADGGDSGPMYCIHSAGYDKNQEKPVLSPRRFDLLSSPPPCHTKAFERIQLLYVSGRAAEKKKPRVCGRSQRCLRCRQARRC